MRRERLPYEYIRHATDCRFDRRSESVFVCRHCWGDADPSGSREWVDRGSAGRPGTRSGLTSWPEISRRIFVDRKLLYCRFSPHGEALAGDNPSPGYAFARSSCRLSATESTGLDWRSPWDPLIQSRLGHHLIQSVGPGLCLSFRCLRQEESTCITSGSSHEKRKRWEKRHGNRPAPAAIHRQFQSSAL